MPLQAPSRASGALSRAYRTLVVPHTGVWNAGECRNEALRAGPTLKSLSSPVSRCCAGPNAPGDAHLGIQEQCGHCAAVCHIAQPDVVHMYTPLLLAVGAAVDS